jgi:hypothetical protein
MKQLKLKNYYFWETDDSRSLFAFLNGLLLHGKESRARTRFLAMVTPRVQEVENQRLEIAKNNAKKNKKGEIVYLDSEGKETEDPKKGKQILIASDENFKKELMDYLNEDYIIDVTPANAEDIYIVRDILNDTTAEFKGAEAQRYFEWTEAFQNIKE